MNDDLSWLPMDKETSLFYVKVIQDIADEFACCKDPKKFDPRSDVRFKNGELMGVWFANNIEKIFSYKRETYESIKQQYKNYRRKKTSYDILQRRKYFYLFLKIDNLNKFNADSGITFPDGTLAGLWFYYNKEEILNSDDVVCASIKKSYSYYLQFTDLKLEFLHAPNEKFRFDGCVRFKTGAIMNFWWETYKDCILSSLDEVSIRIKEQFDYFNNIKKNEGLVKKH